MPSGPGNPGTAADQRPTSPPRTAAHPRPPSSGAVSPHGPFFNGVAPGGGNVSRRHADEVYAGFWVAETAFLSQFHRHARMPVLSPARPSRA